MGAPIVDDERWAMIEPLLPTPKPRRKKYPGRLPVANRAALNGILSDSRLVSAGRTCRQNWDLARVQPAGDGCATGRRLACGSDCTSYCWRSYARQANRISHGQPSTLRLCEPSGWPKNWSEPHGSRATRFQAPHTRRRQWRSCQRDPDRRESQRRHPTAAAG